MRAMLPALFQPRAMAGRIMERKVPSSVSGNALILKANRYCSSSATMKIGMETPASETPMNRWSTRLFCLMAAIIPVPRPSTQANSAASRASSSV